MKKAFKLIGILLVLVILSFAYSFWQSYQKQLKAQAIADNIIENLDNQEIHQAFPEKYFPQDELETLLDGIRENCDWKNRDGKFVDFFSQKNIGGIDQTAFIYEFYLSCDSLRFVLSLNMEKEPELMGFNIEPLEKENTMILFPKKQLKNR